jgi:DNA polymerase-3 subunit delta'
VTAARFARKRARRVGPSMRYPARVGQDREFPGVVGHARVTAMLSRAIERERLHHGLVFAGPRGVGKATLARGLACALNCTVSPAIGCGRCDSCRRLLTGRHTDLVRLEGQGKMRMIATGPAREIALSAQRAPFEGRGHVIVVDPADRMHPAAAAALLKSIEEPNPGVYWVLLATNVRDILDTILSRCMLIPVERLTTEDTLEVVMAVDGGSDAERRELAISLADGSPGVALELLHDASLEPTRGLLIETLRALERGPAAVFAGDRSPLWSAWKTAVLATPEPGETEAEAEPEPEVIVVETGKKAPKKKASKKAAKKSASKSDAKPDSPARQRALAGRLAELWLLHLRERLLGREGLVGERDFGGRGPEKSLHPDSSDAVARQMQAITQFQTNLSRNPNVRLSFEQLLLGLRP